MTLTTEKGKSNKIHIYADGEYICTVYDTVWYTSGIREGDNVSDEELAFLTGEAGFRSAYEGALRILSIRAHGTQELKRKLAAKYDSESIDRAVEKLAEDGYLDDEEYARQLAAELYERKKWAVNRISRELRYRGIDGEIVKIVTETLDNNPVMRIILVLEKKYAGSLDSEKGVRRAYAALQRMGYSASDIAAAFSEMEVDLNEG